MLAAMLIAAMSANIRITFDNATEAQTFGLPPESAATLTTGKDYRCDLWMDGKLACAWKDGMSINFNRDEFTTVFPTPTPTGHPVRII